MNKFLSLIRHALTFGGGLIVANNPGHADTVQTGVGLLTTLIGAAWGAYDEHKAESKK